MDRNANKTLIDRVSDKTLVFNIINNLITNHAYLDEIFKNKEMTMIMVEIMFHYHLDAIDDLISYCIDKSILDKNTMLRDDNIPTCVFLKITDLMLTDIFNHNFNINELTGSLLLICSRAPFELRKMCLKIFNKSNSIEPDFGYKAVVSLVLFRYFSSTVISKHNRNKNLNIVRKCKDIITVFNNPSDECMRSMVRMIIDTGNGKHFDYSIEKNILCKMINQFATFVNDKISIIELDDTLRDWCNFLKMKFPMVIDAPKTRTLFWSKFKIFNSSTPNITTSNTKTTVIRSNDNNIDQDIVRCVYHNSRKSLEIEKSEVNLLTISGGESLLFQRVEPRQRLTKIESFKSYSEPTGLKVHHDGFDF